VPSILFIDTHRGGDFSSKGRQLVLILFARIRCRSHCTCTDLQSLDPYSVSLPDRLVVRGQHYELRSFALTDRSHCWAHVRHGDAWFNCDDAAISASKVDRRSLSAVRCCFYRRCADDGGAAQELTLPDLSVEREPFEPFTPEDVTCELRGVTRGHDHVV
jgi:hypothetical protein